MMKFYGLKTCDTCRKARKALEAAGHTPHVIDVRADGVSADDIDRWITAAGWEAVLNTRSTTWRGLDAGDKADLDAGKAALLMAAHPTLIKRPVIERDGDVFIGWKADVQSVLLG